MPPMITTKSDPNNLKFPAVIHRPIPVSILKQNSNQPSKSTPSSTSSARQNEYETLVASMGLKVTPKPNATLKPPSIKTQTSINFVLEGENESHDRFATTPLSLKTPKGLKGFKKMYFSESFRCFIAEDSDDVDLPEISTTSKQNFYTKVQTSHIGVSPSNENDGDDSNPTGRYLSQIKAMNMVPDAIIARVIESVEDTGRVKLSASSIGDDLAIALSASLSVMYVQYLDISRNHLSDKGINVFLQTSIDIHTIIEINLSFTKLKKKSVEALANIVAESSTLTTLNLEECQLDNACIRTLSESLENAVDPTNPDVTLHVCTLVNLNLSNNKFGDSGAVALGSSFARGNQNLIDLDISHNQIRGSGGCALFNNLNYTNINILDVSNNALGSGDNTAQVDNSIFATTVSQCLKFNIGLIHLGLGYNNLTNKDCNVIGGGLRGNHVLMGLHMEGNSTRVDEAGFLGDRGEDDGDSTSATGANQSHSTRSRGKPFVEDNNVFTRYLPWAFPSLQAGQTNNSWKKQSTHCWICDRWKGKHFVFDPKIDYQKDGTIKSVFLRTNFEAYTQTSMSKCNNGTYEVYKMCPPGRIGFGFEVDDGESKSLGLVFPITSEQICFAAEEVFDGGSGNVTDANHLFYNKPAQKLNHLVITERSAEEDEAMRLLPRPKSDSPSPVPIRKTIRVGWTLRNSIFAGYKSDNAKIYDAAFNVDYDKSKSTKNACKKQVDDEKKSFKDAMQMIFPCLKQIFKVYGASFCSEVWVLGAIAYNQFVSNINILSSEEEGGFTRVEADLIFVSACGTGIRTLSRVGFMDALCNLALSKFIRFGSVKLPSEALKQLYHQYLLPLSETIENEVTFRNDYLYNFDTDRIYKDWKNPLLKVFMLCSGRDDKPGETKMMSLPEYLELISLAGIDDDLPERHVILSFVRSKQTAIDESVYGAKHKRLLFVEFLEVVGRLADKLELMEQVKIIRGEGGGAGGIGEGGEGEGRDIFTGIAKTGLDRFLVALEKNIRRLVDAKNPNKVKVGGGLGDGQGE